MLGCTREVIKTSSATRANSDTQQEYDCKMRKDFFFIDTEDELIFKSLRSNDTHRKFNTSVNNVS